MKQQPLFSHVAREGQETFIRETLQVYAATTIDSDEGWRKLAQRLSFTPASSQKSGVNRMSDNLQASAKGARKKALFLLAAVAVLSLGLLGAGTARMLYFWGGTAGDPGMQRIGDQHLYTAIGQKRQSGQVTITVTAAYADKGRTLIAYTLQPSLEMAKAYQNISVGAYSLTDQDGREGQSSNTTCAAFMHDGSPIHCLITLAPFSLKTGVSNVTMTWDVTKLISVRGNASGFQYLAGDWRFQFTLPVHSLDNGSSGPMAQPTSLP